MTDQTPASRPWTAKRKAAVVLEVLKGQTTSVDACRKYGIKQSGLEEWTERFLEAGEQGLKINPPDEFAEYEAKIKDLQAKVGELIRPAVYREVSIREWTDLSHLLDDAHEALHDRSGFRSTGRRFEGPHDVLGQIDRSPESTPGP